VWSERQQLWIQEQSIAALVVTDQDGRRPQVMITNRLELLSPQVWSQLAAAGPRAQRTVAAQMLEMAKQ
jgi:hypothetical protein